MSYKISALIWDKFPGNGSELLAMLALGEYANEKGMCWPSMRSMASRTRLSESQARRVVHRLIGSGAISVIGNSNGGAPGSSRKYQINFDRWTGVADASPPHVSNVLETGVADARGLRVQRACASARDGSHPCAETGVIAVTPEPSLEPSKNRKRSTRTKITFKKWLEFCKASNEKAIPENDPVFAYGETVCLPADFISLAWHRFCTKSIETGNTQKDWRQTFLNAVKGNWGNIWAIDSAGQYYLTTAGKQLQREAA